MVISDGQKNKAVEGGQRVMVGCSFANDDGGDIFDDFKQKREVADGINHEDTGGEAFQAEETASTEALTSQVCLACGGAGRIQGDCRKAERREGVDNWAGVGWQATSSGASQAIVRAQISSETISSDLTDRLQILAKAVSNAVNQFWVLMNLVQRS